MFQEKSIIVRSESLPKQPDREMLYWHATLQPAAADPHPVMHHGENVSPLHQNGLISFQALHTIIYILTNPEQKLKEGIVWIDGC